MKRFKDILIYLIPLLIWGIYLYLSPYPDTSYTLNSFDLVLLFLLLPIIYGVYGSFARTNKEWLIKSLAFVVIHTFGCWLNDFVYIDKFFSISYTPVDCFTKYLILVDPLILIICYLVKLNIKFKKITRNLRL